MADRSSVIITGEDPKSTRGIVEDVLRDFTDILRAEIRLARAEIKDELKSFGMAGGMFAGGAICGFLAAAALTTCMIVALAIVLPLWLSALIIAVLFAAIAGALFTQGRVRMRQASPPLERTKQQVRSDYQWLKQQIKSD